MFKKTIVSVCFLSLYACSNTPGKREVINHVTPGLVDTQVLKTGLASKPKKGNLIITDLKDIVKISNRCELSEEADGNYSKKSVGARDSDIVTGFGKEVPLSLFTQQIIPSQLTVFWQDTISKSAVYDWDGGKPWLDLLEESGKKLSIKFIVNMNSKTVLVGASKPGKGGVHYTAKGTEESSCVPYFVMQDWVTKRGERIVDVARKWSQKAQWKVVWAIEPDIRVVTGQRIYGDFIDAMQSLVAMAASDRVISDDIVIKYSVGKKTVTVFKERKDRK